MEIENKINEILEQIRPFLISDGGDIEFIKYENNKVYVKMIGACASCHMIDFTLKSYIEEILKEEIDEIKEVINITE